MKNCSNAQLTVIERFGIFLSCFLVPLMFVTAQFSNVRRDCRISENCYFFLFLVQVLGYYCVMKFLIHVICSICLFLAVLI